MPIRFTALIVALSSALSAHASSPAASTPASPAAQTMTYAAVVRLIGETKGDVAKTSPRLVGQAIKLKLVAKGPQSLVVNVKDGVFFTCVERAKGFMGGDVTAKVTKYGLTPDGDVSIHLDRCAK